MYLNLNERVNCGLWLKKKGYSRFFVYNHFSDSKRSNFELYTRRFGGDYKCNS